MVFRMVLAVALTYLSLIHLHRQIYDYSSYALDITGKNMKFLHLYFVCSFIIFNLSVFKTVMLDVGAE